MKSYQVSSLNSFVIEMVLEYKANFCRFCVYIYLTIWFALILLIKMQVIKTNFGLSA